MFQGFCIYSEYYSVYINIVVYYIIIRTLFLFVVLQWFGIYDIFYLILLYRTSSEAQLGSVS